MQITAQDLFDDVEVDLWGANFRLRESTRSVQTKLAESQDKLLALDENDVEGLAAALIEMMDTLLEPLGDAEGKKVHARTVLNKRWEADQLGVDRLMAISDQIQRAVESRGRPPSPQANGG